MTDKQRADMLTEHCRNAVRILSQIIDNGLENESIADIKKFLEILRMEFIIIVGNPDAPEPKGMIKAETLFSDTIGPFTHWLEEYMSEKSRIVIAIGLKCDALILATDSVWVLEGIDAISTDPDDIGILNK